MKKYIVFYTNSRKQNVSIARYVDSREEAMQKLCRQFGWDEYICWIGEKDWSDGIFTKKGLGYEFRITEA